MRVWQDQTTRLIMSSASVEGGTHQDGKMTHHVHRRHGIQLRIRISGKNLTLMMQGPQRVRHKLHHPRLGGRDFGQGETYQAMLETPLKAALLAQGWDPLPRSRNWTKKR